MPVILGEVRSDQAGAERRMDVPLSGGNLPERESADPKAVLLILGGLALLIAIIGLGGGFILATSALFVTTSAAFGRRAILADSAIAIVMTTLIYLAFDRLLTLSLPTGPLERLL